MGEVGASVRVSEIASQRRAVHVRSPVKTISSHTFVDEAQIAASLLEARGIRCLLRDENTVTLNWLYANAIGGVRIAVADEDAESAREILEHAVVDGLQPHCPACGTGKQLRLRLGILTAIGMYVGFILPGERARYHCPQCRKKHDAGAMRYDADSVTALEKEALSTPFVDVANSSVPGYVRVVLGGFSGAVAMLVARPFLLGLGVTEASLQHSFVPAVALGATIWPLLRVADDLRRKHRGRARGGGHTPGPDAD